MFKLFKIIISLVLVAGIGFGGYYLYKKNKVKVDTFFKTSYSKVENFIDDKINKNKNDSEGSESFICDHEYETVTTESTCSIKGSVVVKCKKCGEIKSRENLELKEHAFGSWTINNSPTLLKDGDEKRVCSICHKIEYRKVDKLDYKYVGCWLAFDGEDYIYLNLQKNNGTVGLAYLNDDVYELDIPFGEFDFSDFKVNGYNLYPCVTFDGEEYSDDLICYNYSEDKFYVSELFEDSSVVEFNRLNNYILHEHEFSSEKIYPNCISNGFYIKKCNICGYTETVEIDELGHDYVETVIDPTCTEGGYTVHTSSGCNDSYIDTEVESLGHSYGEYIVDIEPTCTEKGNKHRECSVCGNIETVEIDELGHDYVETVISPTCTEGGYTLHTCSRCNDSYTDTEVESLGHSYTDYVVAEYPTCTENGLKYRTCILCGDTEVVEIPMRGHTFRTIEILPTCTEDGYTLHTCSRCNDSYTDTEVESLGHSYGEYIVYNEPTCTEKGNKHRECSVCGNIETVEIDELGHDYEDTIVSPTCTEGGYTLHTCSRCNDSYTDTEVESLGHSYGEYIVDNESTCTEKGNKHRECSVCGNIETVEIDELGHDYEDTIVSPTCTEGGYTLHTCSRCNDNYITDHVHCIDHDYVSSIVEPTVFENGFTVHKCTMCGESYESDFVDKLNYSSNFGENSWSEISEVSDTIARRNLSSDEIYEIYGWQIGDIKTEVVDNYEDFGTNIFTYRIIDFNHDTLTSDNTKKAGITMQIVYGKGTSQKFIKVGTSYLQSSNSSNAGGWENSDLRSFLSNYSYLSDDLRSVIKSVDKSSANGGSTNYSDIVVTSDKLFVLSEVELTGDSTISEHGDLEGYQYSYWALHNNSEDFALCHLDPDGTIRPASVGQWLRSCSATSTKNILYVNSEGAINSQYSSSFNLFAYAFCI